MDILPLYKREVVFVADPYLHIASYSIDKHFPMKPLLPKTSVSGNSEKTNQITEPVLVAS